MGAFKNCIGANREVERAIGAAKETNARASDDAIRFVALRASRAIRPELRFEIDTRRLDIGKKFEKLEGADCASAHLALPS